MNRERRTWALIWTLLAIVLLVSCGPTSTPTYAPPTVQLLGQETATPAPESYAPPTLERLRTATPTATSTPTATPTPTPTSTPTPTPTPTPICSDTEGEVERGTYFSQILGREMDYLVYLPPCYGVYDRTYPTLYLLHGHPFDEEHWVRLGVDEVADDGIRSDAYPPLIIIMPDGDSSEGGIYVNTSGGERSIEGLIVNELMPQVDATYQTRTERDARAIGGISRGGVWSLEIAFRHPDLFGAVGAHSPALSVNYPHPLYDPYALAAEPGVKELRIYLDAGDVDWARTGTRRLHETLEEEGIGHEYVLGGGSHVDDYWSKMLPAYLAFYTAPWPHPENW